MNDVLKLVAVFFTAIAVGLSAHIVLNAFFPTDAVPTVEEVDADDLTAGRYHQRTRTNDFFRRGRG